MIADFVVHPNIELVAGQSSDGVQNKVAAGCGKVARPVGDRKEVDDVLPYLVHAVGWNHHRIGRVQELPGAGGRIGRVRIVKNVTAIGEVACTFRRRGDGGYIDLAFPQPRTLKVSEKEGPVLDDGSANIGAELVTMQESFGSIAGRVE